MPPYNNETPISIDDAIRHGKTCAPIKCDNEAVCFILATEVERLRAELECQQLRIATCNNIMSTQASQQTEVDPLSEIKIPEPNYEASPPAWVVI
jgi:hypothetical protein